MNYLRGIEGAIPTLMAWGLGLIALALGAVLNAWLHRRRDDRLRRQEADSVAAALYGEVLLMQREIAKAGNVAARISTDIADRRKFDRFFLEENPISEAALYNALASKLGMLPAPEVLAFTEFHAKVQQLRWWLPRMGEDENRPYQYHILYVLEPVRDAIQRIAPTLLEIERRLQIRMPADKPDISFILETIESEQQLLEELEQQRNLDNLSTM